MVLPHSVEAAILKHAAATAPHECCGLVIGTHARIVEAISARNVADDPLRRYVIDPRDHFDAIRCARHLGYDVVGAYHSHPNSAPEPSATDAAEAFGDFLYLIVGRAGSGYEMTGWYWTNGNFIPAPLVRLPEGQG